MRITIILLVVLAICASVMGKKKQKGLSSAVSQHKKHEHAQKKHHKKEAEDAGVVSEGTLDEELEGETLDEEIQAILNPEEPEGVWPIDDLFPQEEAPWVEELRGNQHIMLEKLDFIERSLFDAIGDDCDYDCNDYYDYEDGGCPEGMYDLQDEDECCPVCVHEGRRPCGPIGNCASEDLIMLEDGCMSCPTGEVPEISDLECHCEEGSHIEWQETFCICVPDEIPEIPGPECICAEGQHVEYLSEGTCACVADVSPVISGSECHCEEGSHMEWEGDVCYCAPDEIPERPEPDCPICEEGSVLQHTGTFCNCVIDEIPERPEPDCPICEEGETLVNTGTSCYCVIKGSYGGEHGQQIPCEGEFCGEDLNFGNSVDDYQ